MGINEYQSYFSKINKSMKNNAFITYMLVFRSAVIMRCLYAFLDGFTNSGYGRQKTLDTSGTKM